MKKIILCLTLFLSSHPAQTAYDKTEDFKNKYESSFKNEGIVHNVKNIHFLIVPGLFDSLKRPFYGMTGDYFDYVEWFQNHNITYEILEPYSQRGTDANHSIIHDAIERSSKNVFIIGHSYGGLFTITTLIKYPQLIKKVAAFVSMQTPYYGSHIVEKAMSSGITRSLMEFFFERLVSGTKEAFLELNPEFRKKYLQEEEHNLIQLTQKIPILSIATKEEGTLLQHITQRDFDGLVETSSQCLNMGESSCVVLEGWNHTDTINASLFEKTHVNRKRLLETMIEITLHKAPLLLSP